MKSVIYYILLFICIQFITYYPTVIIWLWKDGMSINNAISLALQGQAIISTPILILSQLLFSLSIIGIFIWHKYCIVSPAWLRTRQWSVVVWSAILSLGTILPSQLIQELLPPLPDRLQQIMMSMMSSSWGYIVICILAPIAEEIVFRGAIERALLQKTKQIWAILGSALLFSLIHANPAQMPHAFIIGIILGWMYARTGSIIPGIVLHWVNNTTAFVIFRLAPNYTDATLIDIFGTPQRVTMAIICSIMILIPALFQLNLRMKTAK